MSRSAPATKKCDTNDPPFNLIFHLDNELSVQQFNSLEALAKFVKANALSWNDYGIIQGEIIKDLPRQETNEDTVMTALESPESGIELLTDIELQQLIPIED